MNRTKKLQNLSKGLLFPLLFIANSLTVSSLNAQGTWSGISFTGVPPKARHENAFVQAGDHFYLLGGRGSAASNVQVKVFDYNTNTWANGGQHPLEMHHFQAVELDGLIYAIGVMTGGFPTETPVPNVYIYNPVNDTWITGPSIPSTRRRGSTGAVVYNGKIYIICGIQNGHQSGWVNWTDVYDPATNSWTQLADAPRARDHFQAVLSGDKIYVAGGRRSGSGVNTFAGTISEVDIYDITNNTWSTLPTADTLPSHRAGTMACLLNNHVVVIGGENNLSTLAEQVVEALNLNTLSWSTWANMNQRRHASQPIVNNNRIYIAAGAGPNRGGGNIPGTDPNYMVQGDFSGSGPAGTTISASALNPVVNSISFGIVQVGNTGSQVLQISNSGGNQGIIIESMDITGTDKDDFATNLSVTLPIVISPGNSFDIDLDFDPSSTGLKTATLTINHQGSNTAVVVSLSGDGGNSPAPVELVDFHAFAQDSSVLLEWATAQELNNDFFTLEHSVTGVSFEEIRRLNGAGTSDDTNEYFYNHLFPKPGINYYRLSQTDYDGTTQILGTLQVQIDIGKVQDFILFPNPLNGVENLMISYQLERASTLSLEVINQMGQVVVRDVQYIRASQGNTQLPLANLPVGTYYLLIRDEQGIIHTDKFLKNR